MTAHIHTTPVPDPAGLEPGTEPPLIVERLTVSSSATGRPVVRDVSLTVRHGEVLGLIGESGSGKTTLGLALLGHVRRGLRITAGSVRVDGQDVLQLRGAALQRFRTTSVSYVPQDPATALNPVLRVRTQFREVFRNSGLSSPEVDRRVALAAVEAGLDNWDELAHRYPHQLSGGQQQRLVIGMAFALHPSLIVFDEPTTGLDVSTQRRILDTIRRLCADHDVSAIYISHDLSAVKALVDRVCVLYAGQIVEISPAAGLFERPAHPYTAGLLAAIPSLDRPALPTGIAGRPPGLGEIENGCVFGPRCGQSTEACHASTPALLTIGAGRAVRCIHADQTPAPASGAAGASEGTTAPRPDVLKVSDLVAGYHGRTVLDGMSLTVAAGECVAVVGESGSGKTTMARCVVGLHRWSAGSVSLNGEALGPGVRSRSVEALRQIQYVFQNPYGSLNPRKTIGQSLAQPLRILEPGLPGRDRDERVVASLQDVALDAHYRDRLPAQLSGGERQRVAIARALICSPRFLVCDEVTSALDVSVQASIVELLDGLRREHGLGLLFITHNLALVRSMAQRVLVLADGRTVETGDVTDVFTSPEHAYTRGLLADLEALGDAAR